MRCRTTDRAQTKSSPSSRGHADSPADFVTRLQRRMTPTRSHQQIQHEAEHNCRQQRAGGEFSEIHRHRGGTTLNARLTMTRGWTPHTVIPRTPLRQSSATAQDQLTANVVAASSHPVHESSRCVSTAHDAPPTIKNHSQRNCGRPRHLRKQTSNPKSYDKFNHGDYRLLQPTAHHRAVPLLTNGRYERRGGDRNAILARPWATPSRSHRRRTWQPATKYILYSGILARSSASNTTRCTRLVWNVASRLVTLATSWPLHTLPRILST